MTSGKSIRAFLREEVGATAVEFALVALLFFALVIGILDVARIMWELNSLKAGTRAAVRYAIVNPPAADDLVDYVSTLPAGEHPTAADVGTYTCTSTACTCAGASGTCKTASAAPNTTFDQVVAIMRAYYAGVQPENVVLKYEPNGLGFSGNPYGPDVEPLVTVRLCRASDGDNCTPLQFAPGMLQAFGLSPFNVPPVASSLSGEDLS